MSLLYRMGHICVTMLWEICSKGGTAIAIDRLANFSDEETEGRSNVSMEEERVARRGWIVNSWWR